MARKGVARVDAERQPKTIDPKTKSLAIGAALGVGVGWLVVVAMVAVMIGRVNAAKREAEERTAETGSVASAELTWEEPSTPGFDTGPSADAVVPPRPELPTPAAPPAAEAKEIDRVALRNSLEEVERRSGGRLALSYIGPDHKTGFAYNGDQLKPAGELTKLCLMVSALSRVDRGEWSMEAPFGGTGMTLVEGIKGMMEGSDPLVANAIIDQVGIEELNREIHSYMALSTNTSIQRKVLDMAARARGLENTITTNDIAQLLFSLGRGELLGGESTELALEALRGQQYRSKIPRGIPSLAGVVVGNRPAELPDLESDAAIIWYPDRRWSVLVVSIDGHQDPVVARQAATDVVSIVWTAAN